ncbi:hypothetical protein R1flu_003737 [Riccia fluitans]|uniref:Fucosyltransferase n=1 Tax=Riccia fluitans TaxID=41844 RepID=A0ABD1Y9U8_9MARC
MSNWRLKSWDRGDRHWFKWSFKQLVAWILSISILYISFSAVIYQQWQIQATVNDNTHLNADEEQSKTSRTQDWMLLERIRGAVRAAGGLPGSRLSDLKMKEWEEQHSCKGRDPLLALWSKKENRSTDRATRRAMTRLLEEYSNLHRICTQGGNMSYVMDLYNQRENGTSKCKFLVVEFGVYGLGNRMLWLVSAYMYALLTQRVLLLDGRDTIHHILCDPFPEGTFWNPDQILPPEGLRRFSALSRPTRDGLQMPVLESLFPRRDPLTHLLRQIVHPVDPIWERVQVVQNMHFRNAKRVLGMQVRFRDGGGMYDSLNSVVNKKITDCALELDLIPSNAFNFKYLKDIEQNGGRPVVIFIASLQKGLVNHFREYYAPILEWQKQKGEEVVKVIQLSHYGFQPFHLDGDFQAFAELLMLSLVDEIFTSPLSTFGYVAQAYGGLRPLLIEFDPRRNTNCQRGQSSDGCYQQGVSKCTCPSEPELDRKPVIEILPYLQPCQDTEGLQLVPPSDV